MTPEDVAARLAEAGITLQPAEHADLAGAQAMLAPMLALIRSPAIPPPAEPAMIFQAEPAMTFQAEPATTFEAEA